MGTTVKWGHLIQKIFSPNRLKKIPTGSTRSLIIFQNNFNHMYKKDFKCTYTLQCTLSVPKWTPSQQVPILHNVFIRGMQGHKKYGRQIGQSF